jgi:hypothetical protein
MPATLTNPPGKRASALPPEERRAAIIEAVRPLLAQYGESITTKQIDPALPFEDQLVEATRLIQRRVVDVWTILSHLGPKRHHQVARPMIDSQALTAIFAAHPDRIRVEPAAAARLLRALTLSLTHPMIAVEASEASDIVDTVLHGVGTGPSA